MTYIIYYDIGISCMYVDLYTAKLFVFKVLCFIYDIIPDNQINTVNVLHFVSIFQIGIVGKIIITLYHTTYSIPTWAYGSGIKYYINRLNNLEKVTLHGPLCTILLRFQF